MDSRIISFPSGNKSRDGYRYGLYFRKLTAPDGTAYERPLIVLRNKYSDIVRFTELHCFAEPYSGKLCIPLISSSNEKLYHVCSMLNYILIEQIRTIWDRPCFPCDLGSDQYFLSKLCV
jgi:hypothetical protein